MAWIYTLNPDRQCESEKNVTDLSERADHDHDDDPNHGQGRNLVGDAEIATRTFVPVSREILHPGDERVMKPRHRNHQGGLDPGPDLAPVDDPGREDQIGRASCRERV